MFYKIFFIDSLGTLYQSRWSVFLYLNRLTTLKCQVGHVINLRRVSMVHVIVMVNTDFNSKV